MWRWLLLAVAVVASAEQFDYLLLNEGVLRERLQLAHRNNDERRRRLKDLFEKSGCKGDAYHEQRVSRSRQPNMICDVAGTGESPRKIIIGAHFDAIGGDGVIDNWSGAVMLPALADFMQRKPRRHPFEFVGFAAEELGLLGSRTFVKSIPKGERQGVAAVIILDSLGLTPTKCWPNGSSKELVAAAARVADALRLDFGGVNVDGVGTTDSEPFKDAHIPVLTLHSVTQETWKVINGDRDVWKAVSWKDYYDTHRLVSALLVYLDKMLP